MIKVSSSLNKIAWIVTVFIMASITIFESYSWGKYLLIVGCILIFFVDLLAQNGRYKIYIGRLQGYIAMLTVFSALSALWGINASECLSKAFTFLQILVCVSIVYNHYYRFDNVKSLLDAVKWSGYVVSIYSIWYYGYDFIIQMMFSGRRIENSYSNINTMGMIAAISIVIQVDKILEQRKISWESLFTVPAFMMVIATQSRKALLILAAGIFMILIFRNMQNKNAIKKYGRILLLIVLSLIAIRALFTLNIFKGIASRMEPIIALFTGSGDVGASISIRQRLIQLGIEIFEENPVLGIGMGCPRIVAAQRLNYDAYLHNGFVEILAGGGIVGFVLYYSMYAYVLQNLYRYRDQKDSFFTLSLVLCLVFLFRDMAMVSLYTKIVYFYLMLLFLEIEMLKRQKKNRKNDEL